MLARFDFVDSNNSLYRWAKIVPTNENVLNASKSSNNGIYCKWISDAEVSSSKKLPMMKLQNFTPLKLM